MAADAGRPMQVAAMPDPALLERIAALRRLSKEDSVPAIQAAIRSLANGGEVLLPRGLLPNLGQKLKGQDKLTLRLLQVVSQDRGVVSLVNEAAVVLSSACSSLQSKQWRGQNVVELGCERGALAGIVAAALGARVALVDTPDASEYALGAIAVNSETIAARGGSVRFREFDWRRPRGDGNFAPLPPIEIQSASILLVADPAQDEVSLRGFVAALAAFLGTDGQPTLCPALERVVVAHKHRPDLCAGGYTAPAVNAPPTIIGDKAAAHSCLFKRCLEDAGLMARKSQWVEPHPDYEHPFVEIWDVLKASDAAREAPPAQAGPVSSFTAALFGGEKQSKGVLMG